MRDVCHLGPIAYAPLGNSRASRFFVTPSCVTGAAAFVYGLHHSPSHHLSFQSFVLHHLFWLDTMGFLPQVSCTGMNLSVSHPSILYSLISAIASGFLKEKVGFHSAVFSLAPTLLFSLCFSFEFQLENLFPRKFQGRRCNCRLGSSHSSQSH